MMMQPAPLTDQSEFAHVSPSRASPWKRIFRIVRWTTYTFALVTIILLLHKAPPLLVDISPQAAARAEEKIEGVEKAVASGQPATAFSTPSIFSSARAAACGLISTSGGG